MPDDDAVLQRLIQKIQLRKQRNARRCHLYLTTHAVNHLTHSGYRALALLLREGYFSTIVSSLPLPHLIEACTSLSIQPVLAHTLTVGLSDEKAILRELDDQNVQPSLVVLPEDKKHISWPGSLQRQLKNYFEQDIVLVGFVDQDSHPHFSLKQYEGEILYYVVPYTPLRNDPVEVMFQQKQKAYQDFVIQGEKGNANAFFLTLALALLPQYRDVLIQNPLAQTPPVSPPPSASTLVNKNDKPLTTPSVSTTPPMYKADVLLAVVTDTEFAACQRCFSQFTRQKIKGKIYYDLGMIGKARTFLVQATNQGASIMQSTIYHAIQVLSPEDVIMVGIAFGLKKESQKLSDILVSSGIQGYDLQKIVDDGQGETRSIERDVRVPVSPRLLDHFRDGRNNWTEKNVHIGMLLSGQKLVASDNEARKLREKFLDALGGEMEALGLYAAARDYKKDWIVVKAISDWGTGAKNDDHQEQAAGNAVRFVKFVIEQEDFLQRT